MLTHCKWFLRLSYVSNALSWCFQTSAVQSNAHDCGVWVLACIAAVLRGYDTTGIMQPDIVKFRDYLLKLVLALPSAL